ncbi:glutamate-rich WD repeat containing protein 1 [Purpureocillium lavendulum]|uniref:Glutamate-rich WD repeat containing protein 1 n=1 Tax=Purpureocillium lavendulum TaxID=1247861 RepID=A0AB34FLJ3_9HYPO|nr:glutamate-rich WD repeat containing protein 1 [Purpureocillium lavendulum]
MDNKPATDDSAGAGSQAVDEAQLKEAMKRLKLLHIKVSDVMFSSFVKAVTNAQNEVKEFADLMRDKESKRALAMADKSREENPFGIKPWKHMDHPDWFTMDKD